MDGNVESLWGSDSPSGFGGVGEVDETFDGFANSMEPAPERKFEVAEVVNDVNLSGAASAEDAYAVDELHQKAAPLIQDTVEREVKTAVKLNNDRLKMEVNEVLADEVGYRLDRYEKRRRARNRREFVGAVLKWGIALIVALAIFGNAQIRAKIGIVAQDVFELVSGLVHNEEVSSNKLVEDIFSEVDGSPSEQEGD